MKSMNQIHQELKAAGFRNTYAGWSTLRQLPPILADDEQIMSVATGWYDGGYATLVATNKRIIFMDKKPISFKVEDIHYEVISDVQHKLGIVCGKVKIHSMSNKVELTSMSQGQIRRFAQFVESKANEMRMNLQNWGEMWGTPSSEQTDMQTVPPTSSLGMKFRLPNRK